MSKKRTDILDILNAAERKLLHDAAQLIDNGAEELKNSSTVTDLTRGKPPQLRWDSYRTRKMYEREKSMAARLRDLARGIRWKVGR